MGKGDLGEVRVQFDDALAEAFHVLGEELIRVRDAIVQVAHLIERESTASIGKGMEEVMGEGKAPQIAFIEMVRESFPKSQFQFAETELKAHSITTRCRAIKSTFSRLFTTEMAGIENK